MLKYSVPRWYQELSIPQTKRVFALGKIIKCDYDATVTGKTRKCLREIGITSTFVKISSKEIKKAYKASELDSAKFLCEIYRYITGNYFEEEGYKKFYDCNERIVLSSIAFLKFTETILELHQRLPMGEPIKLPKKPIRPKYKPRKSNKSPYLDEIAVKINWKSHRNELEKWRNKVNSIVSPIAILPSINSHDVSRHLSLLENNKLNNDSNVKSYNEPNNELHSKPNKKSNVSSNYVQSVQSRKKNVLRKYSKIVESDEKKIVSEDDIKKSIHENDFTDDSVVEDSNMTIGRKKNYPPGRENLSLKWQSWLHEWDTEFQDLSRKADCLLDSVREITKLIFNPDACDNCCACRQTRKTISKKQETPIPLLIIDSFIVNSDENKYIIGSLKMESPILSPSDSLLNLPQIIPSQEQLVKKKIINGIMTDDDGIIRYFISEVIKDVQYIPKKIIHLLVPIKNVPPCNCKKNGEIVEPDECKISCAVDGSCIAKKYRSDRFAGCIRCTNEHFTDKIYRDFEKSCREREIKKQKFQIPIDHTTCTQRLFHDDEIIKEVVIEPEPEKCTKCHETFGKCQPNFLRKIIDQIHKEQLLNRSKVSKKLEIKEYRDNIKFSVDRIIQNDSGDDKMAKCILSGITLHTPITITPVSSSDSSSGNESDLLSSFSRPHYHWSVMDFTPKPQIDEKIKSASHRFNNEKKKKINDSIQKSIGELLAKVQQLDILKESVKEHLVEKKEKVMDREKGGGDTDINENTNVKWEKKAGKDQLNLPKLMKITLTEMAEEGFLLAKLPECHKIPQLQIWIMFREGFIMTKKKKAALLKKTQQLWNNAESRKPASITMSSMQISEKEKETLTYSDIRRIEQELKLKRKIFHSKVRKLRVLESHAMWNLMDYQMFPSLAFKQAYFVYQASKESDGHVEIPYGFTRSS